MSVMKKRDIPTIPETQAPFVGKDKVQPILRGCILKGGGLNHDAMAARYRARGFVVKDMGDHLDILG